MVPPRPSRTQQTLHKPEHTEAQEMNAASDLVSPRNVPTTVRASSSTKRQEPPRHAPDYTNRIAPNHSKPNGLLASRSLNDEERDLIKSDIWGQDIYGNRNGMNDSTGIANDIANYKLSDDEVEDYYSFAGRRRHD